MRYTDSEHAQRVYYIGINHTSIPRYYTYIPKRNIIYPTARRVRLHQRTARVHQVVMLCCTHTYNNNNNIPCRIYVRAFIYHHTVYVV